MHVLLVTDSSFCPDTGAAGWAVAGMSDRGEIFTGGVIEKKVGTNNIAECIALSHGLKAAIKAGVIENSDYVLCLSDSHYVRDRLRPGYVGKTAKKTAQRTGRAPYSFGAGGSPKSEIETLMRQYDLTLVVEFIDGHGKGKSTNTLLMKKVDKLSRKNMTLRRNVLARQAFL